MSTLWHLGLNLRSRKSPCNLEPISLEGSSQRSYFTNKSYFIQGIALLFTMWLSEMIEFSPEIYNLESNSCSFKPLHCCLLSLLRETKITLIWKHHQNLSRTTWNTFLMLSGERSRDEISDPVLTLVALVLNKLNFTT